MMLLQNYLQLIRLFEVFLGNGLVLLVFYVLGFLLQILQLDVQIVCQVLINYLKA